MWKIESRHKASMVCGKTRPEPPRQKAGWLWSRHRESDPGVCALLQYKQSLIAALPIARNRLPVLSLHGIARTRLSNPRNIIVIGYYLLDFRDLFAIMRSG